MTIRCLILGHQWRPWAGYPDLPQFQCSGRCCRRCGWVQGSFGLNVDNVDPLVVRSAVEQIEARLVDAGCKVEWQTIDVDDEPEDADATT